jgi:site-specific recombinase XerC
VARSPTKLPLVLSAEEIERFLDAVTGLRNRVVLATACAAGLRVSEVVRLKVSSIDSKRMLIHIENGKAGKDRYAMLSPRLLDILSCVLDASTAGAVAISWPPLDDENASALLDYAELTSVRKINKRLQHQHPNLKCCANAVVLPGSVHVPCQSRA